MRDAKVFIYATCVFCTMILGMHEGLCGIRVHCWPSTACADVPGLRWCEDKGCVVGEKQS